MWGAAQSYLAELTSTDSLNKQTKKSKEKKRKEKKEKERAKKDGQGITSCRTSSNCRCKWKIHLDGSHPDDLINALPLLDIRLAKHMVRTNQQIVDCLETQ